MRMRYSSLCSPEPKADVSDFGQSIWSRTREHPSSGERSAMRERHPGFRWRFIRATLLLVHSRVPGRGREQMQALHRQAQADRGADRKKPRIGDGEMTLADCDR